MADRHRFSSNRAELIVEGPLLKVSPRPLPQSIGLVFFAFLPPVPASRRISPNLYYLHEY